LISKDIGYGLYFFCGVVFSEIRLLELNPGVGVFGCRETENENIKNNNLKILGLSALC
jgi:hypothetical protein